MEFKDVVRGRRMVRTFQDVPVARAVVDRILTSGHRAPSAGYTQGYAFLVFEGPEETNRFWDVVSEGDRDWPHEGLRRAPVIVVVFGSKKAYLDRYAEPDKGWTDRDESRWGAPYWHIDAAFAAMLMLLSAVDEGLGALFFGLYPPTTPAFKQEFGVPDEWEPIGAIALGHAAPDPVQSSADTRTKKSLEEILHRGHW
ncbi:MAG: nitroreductase family protein [Actinomycetota bacterium]|nr:nitroreductase family protein [Actinomycetota bacterium]